LIVSGAVYGEAVMQKNGCSTFWKSGKEAFQ
jgi:hypothetical protein